MTDVPQLFPVIERLVCLSFVKDVGHGVSQAQYVSDGSGRKWVRKLTQHTTTAEMLAEGVAYLLGRQLNAPVPEFAVCLEGGDDAHGCLSHRVEPALHWNADSSDYIINYEQFGAMVTLDVIIMNDDRHAANVLLEPADDELHVRVWAIDHGIAQVGLPRAFETASARDRLPGTLKYCRDFPLSAMKDGAVAAAELAAGLSEDVLRSITAECCAIADEKNTNTLLSTLKARCAAAPTLLGEFWKILEANSE